MASQSGPDRNSASRPVGVTSNGDASHREPQSLLTAAFQALLNDTEAAVAVCTLDGRMHLANSTFFARLGGGESRTGPDASGQSIRDVLPSDVATEILSVIRRCVQDGSSAHIRGTIRGVASVVHLRPIQQDDGAAVLVVVTPAVVAGGATGGSQAPTPANHHDLGPLGMLTARETEVLRHIGMGLSTADIAKELHRSVKTIEWHRVALGNKLGVSNRVELARIAINAGLSPLPGIGAVGAPTVDGRTEVAETVAGSSRNGGNSQS